MNTLQTSITITYFTDSLDDLVTDTITQLKDNNFNITHLIVGKHTDASRHHYHLGIVVTYTGKAYLKHFNRSLTTKLKGLPADKKISFYHSNAAMYVRNKGLMYPLKEKLHEDENIELYNKYSIGVSTELFYNLLAEAQEIYTETKIKKDAYESEKKIKTDTAAHKYELLSHTILEYGLSDFKDLPTYSKVRMCLTILLKHAKQEYKDNDKHVFRINSMRELSISYLYNTSKITECELINFSFPQLNE